MRDIYGTVTGVKRPSQEQENRDQGRNSREENFDIRKTGLNGGFDSLGREAAANELTPDERRLIETIFAAAEQVRQEKKAASGNADGLISNTQDGNGISSDNSSSGKTITGVMENDIGGKTGSGRGTASQISRAGQDIEVRATNLSQGNSVYYDNGTGDITITTDEGYKTVLKKGKDYYIGQDNKAYYINKPAMAIASSGGQDNDWQFSEDGTKLTNKATGYVLDEGKDYYTGSDGVAYYYNDVRASNAENGTGVEYDHKGRISLNYIDGSSDLLREGEQYYIGADGKPYYFEGPPSPNPEGMDDDDGDPLWLVDDIFEGWNEEEEEEDNSLSEYIYNGEDEMPLAALSDEDVNLDALTDNSDEKVSPLEHIRGHNIYYPPSNNKEEKAAEKVKTNMKNIFDAANYYGVDPQIVAGVIYAEQSQNVNFRDTLTDWIGFYGLDTSVGVGQVKMSTAELLEDKGYVAKTTADEGGWDLPIIGDIDGTVTMAREKRLENDRMNIIYVAAYIKYLQDTWQSEFPTIAKRPDILGTLYNLGHEKTSPHSKPTANYFGDFVQENYDKMGYLLGLQ